MGLPERIKAAREKAGLTQEQAAELVGFRNVSSWCDIEKGRSRPSVDRLRTMATVLSVSADYLLGLQMHITVAGTEFAELPPDAQKCVEDLIDYLLRSAERKGDE